MGWASVVAGAGVLLNIWKSGLRVIFAGIAGLLVAGSARAQQIAFTWDDVPSHGPLPLGDIRLGISHKIWRRLCSGTTFPTCC
jgi:hypothetical protein